MHANWKCKLTTLTAAMTAIHGQAHAAEGEAEIRRLSKPDSVVSVGVGVFNGHREQLGKYDGLDRDRMVPLIDADVRRRDDASGTWTTFSARNLGFGNGELHLGYEQQGNWGAWLEYSQSPSLAPQTILTGVRGIGTNTLQYGTIGATTAAAQAGLFPANSEVHLSTRRDITTLNLNKVFGSDWALNLNFRNEDKKGGQLWGRGVNPEFAVQPIDWNTQQADATLSYATKRLQVAGGVSVSAFRNAFSYVDTIGGSQTSAPGANFSAGHTFLSVPLDNQAHQYFVDAGYAFSNDTRGSLRLSRTHATQNDDLSVLTSAIQATGATGSSGAFAPSRLNGVIDTTTVNIGLTSRLSNKLNVMAKYDYNDRDDKTPIQIFGLTALPGGQPNNPHSYKREALKLEATYRLPDGYGILGGVEEERRKIDLNVTSAGTFAGAIKLRSDVDETTWRLQLNRAMSADLNGSIAYLHGKRDGSTWQNPVADITTGLPGGYVDATPVISTWTNPFAYADRTRDKLRALLDWSPRDTFSLQADWEVFRDKYEPANSGLQDGRGWIFALDANLALGKNWQMNGWFSHDVTKFHQRGITYDPRTTSATGLRDESGALLTTFPGSVGWLCSSVNTGPGQCNFDLLWDARLKDIGNSIGFGIKGKASAAWTVGANLQWTETKAKYPIDSNVPSYNTGATGSLTANRSRQGLPDITATMTKLGLFGQYALQKNADVRIDFMYQRWNSDDWTWLEWNSAGTELMPFTYMDGTRVVPRQNQSATFVGARYAYKFQ